MARINLSQTDEVISTNRTVNTTLDELILQYAFNKGELDSYTKICKEENEQIKAQMADMGEDTYSAGG